MEEDLIARLSKISEEARTIGNTIDIFSGKPLKRQDHVKKEPTRGVYFDGVRETRTTIIDPGEGGTIYCVAFRIPYLAELGAAIQEVAARTTASAVNRKLRKPDPAGGIGTLATGIEATQNAIARYIMGVLSLGEDGGILSRSDFGKGYSVGERDTGIFITGENNLVENTTLNWMCQNSAISAQLNEVLRIIGPNYKQAIDPFLGKPIEVISQPLDYRILAGLGR